MVMHNSSELKDLREEEAQRLQAEENEARAKKALQPQKF
jgi:hypothetical protein